MVVIVSCHHFPDDERIYHKQIKSLLDADFSVLYFTRSSSSVNLSDRALIHENLSINTDLNTFIKGVFDFLRLRSDIKYVQIHETDLLPLLKKIKEFFPGIYSVYDVHENMEALYRTFSNRIKPIKEILIKVRNFNENRYLKYVDQIIIANPPMYNDPYENKPTRIVENFPKIGYLDTSINNKDRKKDSIIYHGHLASERGIKDLINAMKYVKSSIPSASLSLVGTFRTKEFENEINDLIKELALNSSIHVLGQVPHSEIWEIIKSHSIGVIPFRRTPLTEENTPTKLFEMMICGLEIVITKLPPAQYFLEDSVHWCEPNNIQSIASSIIDAYNTQDDLTNIQKNQDLIEKKYNWEIRQDNYLAIFRAQ